MREAAIISTLHSVIHLPPIFFQTNNFSGHCPECYTDVTANRKKNSSAAAATTANLTHESSSGAADVKANVTNQSSASAVGTANLTIESSSAADAVRKNKSSAAAAVSANVTSLPPGAADDISEIAAAAARDFEDWPRQLPLQELVRPKVLGKHLLANFKFHFLFLLFFRCQVFLSMTLSHYPTLFLFVVLMQSLFFLVASN